MDTNGKSFFLTVESHGESLTQVHIVRNWFDELERLVPREWLSSDESARPVLRRDAVEDDLAVNHYHLDPGR